MNLLFGANVNIKRTQVTSEKGSRGMKQFTVMWQNVRTLRNIETIVQMN